MVLFFGVFFVREGRPCKGLWGFYGSRVRRMRRMTRDAWLNAADLIPTACRRCTITFAHCTEIILYMCAFVWTLTLYTGIFGTLLNGFHRQVYSVVLGFQWRDCIWATKKRVHAPPLPCPFSMPAIHALSHTNDSAWDVCGTRDNISCILSWQVLPWKRKDPLWSLKLRLLNPHPLRQDKGQ